MKENMPTIFVSKTIQLLESCIVNEWCTAMIPFSAVPRHSFPSCWKQVACPHCGSHIQWQLNANIKILSSCSIWNNSMRSSAKTFVVTSSQINFFPPLANPASFTSQRCPMNSPQWTPYMQISITESIFSATRSKTSVSASCLFSRCRLFDKTVNKPATPSSEVWLHQFNLNSMWVY